MVNVNKTEYEFQKETFESFCNLYQLKFPQEFIDYLSIHNDAELEPNIVSIGDNECCIRYFYGTSKDVCSDICIMYKEYQKRLPEKCVPIADPDFGNQICISLLEDTYGKIYFWDHETMDTDVDDVCEITLDNMLEIAGSFNELLDCIKESSYVMQVVSKPSFFENMVQYIKVNLLKK